MLILVRHGQTVANAEGRLVGRLESPLTELGRRQAAAVAVALVQSTPVARVISSPLQRAKETAAEFGVPVVVDERWIEADYGRHDGQRLSEVPRALWARWQSDATFAPDGAESLADVAKRVRHACEELASDARSGDVVVVSHVSPIKAAVVWALGVAAETAWRMFLAPASICRIAVGPTGPSLQSFNESAHLIGVVSEGSPADTGMTRGLEGR